MRILVMAAVFRGKRMPNPTNQKALPRDRKGLDSASALAAKNARPIPSGRTPCGRAGAFASGTGRSQKSLRTLREFTTYHRMAENARRAREDVMAIEDDDKPRKK